MATIEREALRRAKWTTQNAGYQTMMLKTMEGLKNIFISEGIDCMKGLPVDKGGNATPLTTAMYKKAVLC